MSKSDFFQNSHASENNSDTNDERHICTLSPSLLLAFSTFFWAFIIAIVSSFVVPLGLKFLDTQLYNFVGFDMQYQRWYILLLVIIWFLCLAPALWKLLVIATTKYEFTNQRLTYSRGVLNRKRDQIEIARIRDIGTYKPFLQRIFGLGELMLDTADRTHPYLVLPGQKNVNDIKDWLHSLNVSERSRLGYREFENTN